ncbi:YbaB/EbfC family nucleoid-associated protein [Allokutzneria albata]|uniref:YbaB/EbfC DNA-binding family protein n=1 Tax=Allokutzneria albata TaxID=211114 RepID=A0A1H0DKJ2_ALLAB|nr:YbaB/EbfC family nucleoid-associated protein [Allokutzneria albata]SDN70654.1 YbaB/EbfC DNA-binding family protein [Allokutzneria albata]
MFEARIVEFEQLKRDIDEKLEQVQFMTAALASERFQAWSQKRNVQAVVNGNGELLDIIVAKGALRSAHPHLLGPEVVEAVSAARGLAGAENRRRLRNIVPTMVPDDEER